MDKFKKPAVAGAVFFTMIRAYTIAMRTDIPIELQLMVTGVLAGSTYVTGLVEFDEPATKSLTAGSLFAGAMYLGLGNENVVLNGTLGTISAYASEVLVSEETKKPKTEEETIYSKFASVVTPSNTIS